MFTKVALLFLFAVIVLIAAGVWLWFKLSQPQKFATNEIAYPCLRIHDSNSWEIIQDESQLHRMNSNLCIMRVEDPWVIDSDLRVMEMHKMEMKTSAYWLMFTGPQMVDVSFELQAATGKPLEEAKRLVGRVLQSVDAQLKPELADKLAKANTLRELTDLLISEDVTGKYSRPNVVE